MTIPELLRRWAEATPDAPALMAPGREPLSYRQLFEQTEAAAGQLRSLGVGSDDRVALVHQNGPELAAAFLAVSSAAVCAPLNPSYRQSEFDFYLADLHAKAIVLGAEDDSPLRDLARRRASSPSWMSSPAEGDRAGAFRFSDGSGNRTEPREDDTALVLHTSGTTARPKIVPLTHRLLTLSARNVASTLELTPGDRCLNVMPLFHIHGLVACASLVALRRRERHLHARIPRAVVPRLAGRAPADLVHRRTDHAPGGASHGKPSRAGHDAFASYAPPPRRSCRVCARS